MDSPDATSRPGSYSAHATGPTYRIFSYRQVDVSTGEEGEGTKLVQGTAPDVRHTTPHLNKNREVIWYFETQVVFLHS